MLKLIPVIFSLLFTIKCYCQDTPKLISNNIGFSINAIPGESPDFTLPVGGGLNFSSTLNKFFKIKPFVEFSVLGFPEFVIHLFANENRNNDNKYSYSIYNFLAGTKYKITTKLKVMVALGPTNNTKENTTKLGIKSGLEINNKKEKFSMQFYYLKIKKGTIIDGYGGISFNFKI